MGFLSQMRDRLQRWMYGRNGADQLSRDLNIIALALMVLDFVLRTQIIYWVGLLFFFVALFRMLSRNLIKRSAENMKYYNLKSAVKNWVGTKRKHFASRKYYRYYTCTTCGQRLRVPKGKGKIEISCPKCASRFVKKT
ncbi:MAG: hypothetical protein ACERKO_08640 [Acetanaerobacterium sp.]